MLPEYCTTKFEAEKYVIEECSNLEPVMLRPGFIFNKEFRSWSIPLYYGCELLYQVHDKVYKHTPLNKYTDQFFPAKPTKLETVGHYSVEGAMGKLKPGVDVIDGLVTAEMMIEYEKTH